VQKLIGDALQLVQFGGMPLEAKPFKGVGGGVYEIVRRFDTDTYRAVYAAQIADEIYSFKRFLKEIEIWHQNARTRCGVNQTMLSSGVKGGKA
jgi:phage-related protein